MIREKLFFFDCILFQVYLLPTFPEKNIKLVIVFAETCGKQLTALCCPKHLVQHSLVSCVQGRGSSSKFEHCWQEDKKNNWCLRSSFLYKADITYCEIFENPLKCSPTPFKVFFTLRYIGYLTRHLFCISRQM